MQLIVKVMKGLLETHPPHVLQYHNVLGDATAVALSENEA